MEAQGSRYLGWFLEDSCHRIRASAQKHDVAMRLFGKCINLSMLLACVGAGMGCHGTSLVRRTGITPSERWRDDGEHHRDDHEKQRMQIVAIMILWGGGDNDDDADAAVDGSQHDEHGDGVMLLHVDTCSDHDDDDSPSVRHECLDDDGASMVLCR